VDAVENHVYGGLEYRFGADLPAAPANEGAEHRTVDSAALAAEEFADRLLVLERTARVQPEPAFV